MLLAASRAISRWPFANLRMLLLDPLSLASSFAAGLLPDFSAFPGWTVHATAALALALADYIGVNFGASFASEVAIPHQLARWRLQFILALQAHDAIQRHGDHLGRKLSECFAVRAPATSHLSPLCLQAL
jgi:hypothetical protein